MPNRLFEVPSLFLPSLPFRIDSTTWVYSLFVTLSKASTYRSGSTPSLCSVLRLSQPLDGLLRFRCRGLISSHCRVQGSFRSGVSPALQPSQLIAARCPHAVGLHSLVGEPTATPARPQLRGFTPQNDAFLRVGFYASLRPFPSSDSSSFRLLHHRNYGSPSIRP
jgi:hypothetical protein